MVYNKLCKTIYLLLLMWDVKYSLRKIKIKMLTLLLQGLVIKQYVYNQEPLIYPFIFQFYENMLHVTR